MFNFTDEPRLNPKASADNSKYFEIAKALSANPHKYLQVTGFSTGSGVDYMKKRLRHYLPNGEVRVTRAKVNARNYIAEAVYLPY